MYSTKKKGFKVFERKKKSTKNHYIIYKILLLFPKNSTYSLQPFLMTTLYIYTTTLHVYTVCTSKTALHL